MELAKKSSLLIPALLRHSKGQAAVSPAGSVTGRDPREAV